jgi:threonine/homoserine/homoserine lactone efflux protein
MQDGLTLANALMVFGAMAVLAAVPSVSVLAVSARAAACGFGHGAMTALGIVAGDLLFILLAVFGLVLLVETLDGLFVVVRYVAAGYLIWLGIGLLRSTRQSDARESALATSRWSSFAIGLLITLGDQKAILFYFAFFPAFLDLDALAGRDVLLLLLLATVAVGGVKLVYAGAAARLGTVPGSRFGHALKTVAAGLLVIVGVYLLTSM